MKPLTNQPLLMLPLWILLLILSLREGTVSVVILSSFYIALSLYLVITKHTK